MSLIYLCVIYWNNFTQKIKNPYERFKESIQISNERIESIHLERAYLDINSRLDKNDGIFNINGLDLSEFKTYTLELNQLI